MKRFLLKIVAILALLVAIYFAFIYFVPYSEGIRAGKLVKFSHKGFLFKTWEGELSQGVSEAQLFKFSVEEDETEVLESLTNLQGKYVTLHYFERFQTLFWLGDTKYFISKVEANPILEYP